MLGMVNFVASDENMAYLDKHSIDLRDFVIEMENEGIFVNVAPDIHKRNDLAYTEKYREFIAPRDWDYLMGKMSSWGTRCEAANTYFLVDWDGTITTCVGLDSEGEIHQGSRVAGSFFVGKLERRSILCGMKCSNCIVMYVQRRDNTFPASEHLKGYRARQMQWRKAYRQLHAK